MADEDRREAVASALAEGLTIAEAADRFDMRQVEVRAIFAEETAVAMTARRRVGAGRLARAAWK
jgi:hypothetical protein